MNTGGKYAAEVKKFMDDNEINESVVIILDGKNGKGFSYAVHDDTRLPQHLRELADKVDLELAERKLETKDRESKD